MLVDIEVPHYRLRLYPPVVVRIGFCAIGFVHHASVVGKPFGGSYGYLLDDRFHFCQQFGISQFQGGFVDEPRGFDVVSVGDDGIFAVPVIIEEQLEMVGIRMLDFFDEKQHQVSDLFFQLLVFPYTV